MADRDLKKEDTSTPSQEGTESRPSGPTPGKRRWKRPVDPLFLARQRYESHLAALKGAADEDDEEEADDYEPTSTIVYTTTGLHPENPILASHGPIEQVPSDQYFAREWKRLERLAREEAQRGASSSPEDEAHLKAAARALKALGALASTSTPETPSPRTPQEGSMSQSRVRLTFEVSAQINRVLESLAATMDTTKSEVLRRAIALLKVAKEAEEQGHVLGVLEKDTKKLVSTIVGL